MKMRIYRESFSYIKESRKFIYFAIALFFVSSVFGVLFSSKLGFFDDLIKEIISKTEGFSVIQLIIYIFRNNLMAALFSLFLGIFIGVFPLINAITNGLLIGYVLALSYKITNSIFVVWRLVPHGIFELPAIFIAIGLGVRLGMFVFSKNRKKAFMYRLDKSLKVFVSVVIPLLAVAAIIESILIRF